MPGGFTAADMPRRAHVIMAMANARLNQFEQAQSELAQCREVIESKPKGHLGEGNYETGFWKDWLIDRILLREAEGLIQAQKKNKQAARGTRDDFLIVAQTTFL